MWTGVKEKLPEFDKMVCVLCDDFMGEYEYKAKRVQYKKPPKKGKPLGWRWIGSDGENLGRKGAPSAWTYLEGNRRVR